MADSEKIIPSYEDKERPESEVAVEQKDNNGPQFLPDKDVARFPLGFGDELIACRDSRFLRGWHLFKSTIQESEIYANSLYFY